MQRKTEETRFAGQGKAFLARIRRRAGIGICLFLALGALTGPLACSNTDGSDAAPITPTEGNATKAMDPVKAKRYARQNMQAVTVAMDAYQRQNKKITTNLADLKQYLIRDYGGVNSPGPESRKYSVTPGPGKCDHDGDPATPDAEIPQDSYAVKSTVPEDGCYIPGVSK